MSNSAELAERLPTVISAASPDMCCEQAAPPTRIFSSGQRYPLLIFMGEPHISRSGSSSSLTSNSMLRFWVAEGSFGSACACAIAERVNSSAVKYFPILFSVQNTKRYGQAVSIILQRHRRKPKVSGGVVVYQKYMRILLNKIQEFFQSTFIFLFTFLQPMRA